MPGWAPSEDRALRFLTEVGRGGPAAERQMHVVSHTDGFTETGELIQTLLFICLLWPPCRRPAAAACNRATLGQGLHSREAT